MKRILVLMGIVMIVGCEKGEKTTEKPIVGREYAIKALEGIIESGQGGSEIGAVVQELEKLKASEPQLAEELINDSNELMASSNAEELRSRAQAMIDKLKGGSGGAAGETTEGEPAKTN